MKAGEYAAAAKFYTRLLLLPPAMLQGPSGGGSPDHTTIAYANRAQAHLYMKEWRMAIHDATDALRRDPTHVKSWVRRAAGRTALGMHAAASRDLRAAFALDPANKTVLAELRKAEESARACSKRLPEVAVAVLVAGEEEEEGGQVEEEDGGEENAA
jgi:tetratricopeptide (TPR) repeat protein